MLIHNAGIASAPANAPSKTKYGKDLIYVTNFLTSFLATNILTPHLSATARVVFTSSTGHYSAAHSLFDTARVDKHEAPAPPAPNFLQRTLSKLKTWMDLQDSDAPAYSKSKAHQVLFASLLQSHFSSSSSSTSLSPHPTRTAHSFTPGFTTTPIFSKLPLSWRTCLSDPLFALLKISEKYIAVDTHEGAQTGAWLAAEGDRLAAGGQGGGYWEWGVRRTSLVDFVRGRMGEREFGKRAGEEWRGWEKDVGVEWDLGM